MLIKEVACPTMTLSELHARIVTTLTAKGYENLDFMGNLGHSIEKNLDDRVWFDAASHQEMGSVGMFTFEPHIRRVGGEVGVQAREHLLLR